MVKNKRDRDDFGFSEDYQYDREVDYPEKKKKTNIKQNCRKFLFKCKIPLIFSDFYTASIGKRIYKIHNCILAIFLFLIIYILSY